jgi:hypothetical protein
LVLPDECKTSAVRRANELALRARFHRLSS